METLPCGCQMGTTPDNAFVFRPHALDCENYLYVLAEVERQGKPLAIIQEN